MKGLFYCFVGKEVFLSALFASAVELPSDTLLVQVFFFGFFFPLQILPPVTPLKTLNSASSAVKVLTVCMDDVIADRVLSISKHVTFFFLKKKPTHKRNFAFE